WWMPRSSADSRRPAGAWPADDKLFGLRPAGDHSGGEKEEETHLMAELTIKPEEIRAALDSFVSSYEPATSAREEVGTVTLAADGIAQVEGLPGVMANELLRFEDGTLGLALNLDVREVGVVVLGE